MKIAYSALLNNRTIIEHFMVSIIIKSTLVLLEPGIQRDPGT